MDDWLAETSVIPEILTGQMDENVVMLQAQCVAAS